MVQPIATAVSVLLGASVLGVTLGGLGFLLLVGAGLFAAMVVRKGPRYEKWLRFQMRHGRFAAAIAHYRSEKRFEEAALAMARSGDTEGAAQLFVKLGKPGQAAEIFEQAGDLGPAAIYFMQAKDRPAAARCYRRQGDLDRAVQVLREGGLVQAAAEVYLDRRRKDLAAQLYSDEGHHEEAARLFLEVHDEERAAEEFHRAGRFVEAAEIYEKTDHLAEAAEAYEKAGNVSEAVRLLDAVGDNAAAAKVLSRAGAHADAGARLIAAGRLAEAADEIEAAGETKKASRVRAQAADEQRRPEEAGEHYLAAGCLPEAAARFTDAGAHARAGETYVRMGKLREAGAAFAKAGRFEEAAESFYAAGDQREAAACALKAGQVGATVRYLQEAGDPLNLARVYYKMGEIDKALAALNEISDRSRDYLQALQMIAHVQERRGDLAGARDALDAYLARAGLGVDTVDIAYRIAEYEGQLGNKEEALRRLQHLRDAGLAPEGFDDQLEYFRRSVERPIAATSSDSTQPTMPDGRSFVRDSIREAATMGVASLTTARYRFLQKIGGGSYGEVYRVEDTSLDREVAMKVIHAADSASQAVRDMFLREARVIAKLNHPSVVTIHDIGEMGNRLYMTMEFVEGENLAEIMDARRRPMEIHEVLSVGRQLIEALVYAHERNVIHRDVKLENAMVTRDGRVKVLDFGLAGILGEGYESSLMMVGTPQYMAPEVIVGGQGDARTDVYAFGVLLYCVTTARFPFEGDNVLELHRYAKPYDPALLNPDLPDELRDLILRCMDKDPVKRCESSSEIVEALAAIPI